MNEPGLNHEGLKQRNQALVLQTILERGAISRRDIALATGLTATTAGNLTADLIRGRLVQEKGTLELASDRRGPRPVLLTVSDGPPYVLALQLGVGRLEGALVNLRGEIVASGSLLLDDRPDIAAQAMLPLLLAAVEELAGTLCGRQGIDLRRDVLAVGFASGGTYDRETGSLFYHRHRPYAGLPILRSLRATLPVPVFAGNRTQAFAEAEAWFGKGHGYDYYFFVLVEDIVNSAFVAKRSVLRGKGFYLRSIGHLEAEPEGPLCHCGMRGCLEAVASDLALLRDARQLAAAGGSLGADGERSAVSKESIVRAVEQDNEAIAEILRRRAAHLGRGIANAVNVVDVQAVILAWNIRVPESPLEIASLGEAYLNNLRTPVEIPDLVVSDLKGERCLLAPAILAIREVISPQLRMEPSSRGMFLDKVAPHKLAKGESADLRHMTTEWR